eukprot:TRINITY_DN10659_c0_g1_i1.p1 TRINITY_DN10659_c0_g1~~TRINITY_DN10659_c0_g1_i1.p1  ORF type:complete len:369 (+),score=61.28 TRINITY_DN10659_c0_g1_i1:43-1149(+)
MFTLSAYRQRIIVATTRVRNTYCSGSPSIQQRHSSSLPHRIHGSFSGRSSVHLPSYRSWITTSESPHATKTPATFSSSASVRASTATMTKFKFAACQLLVGKHKEENIAGAIAKIDEAAKAGAQVVCLPECFNSPYSNDSFPTYAESIPDGPSCTALAAAAKKHGVVLIGGSIPEVVVAEDGSKKLYNTCVTFGPDGNVLGTHRKVHLFDIDIPGKMTFKESDTLTAGDRFTAFDTPYGRFGIGICYDIRFPELSALYASEEKCDFLVFPGAFNTVTGPLHWELLLRARAVDNQLFTAAVSPARNPKSGYQAWGHSSVVSPWGEVIATTEHGPDIVYADIDIDQVEEFRTKIPTRTQKRKDIYLLKKV